MVAVVVRRPLRWSLWPATVFSLLLLLLPLVAAAAGAGYTQSEIHPRGLIVEFRDNLEVDDALAQFRKEAAQNNIDLDITSVYSSIFKAASVYTKDPHNQAVIDQIKSLSPVFKVYTTRQYRPRSQEATNDLELSLTSSSPNNGRLVKRGQRPKSSPSLSLASSLASDKTNFTLTSIDGSVYNIHKLTGVDKLHARGLTGKGVKIGIIDSGVDYHHPELGNCWKTPGCPFQYGYDFVGDEHPSEGNIHTPDDDPYTTCNGHGTHLAGIIAGKGPLVKGVAPGATLGMYRVFNCVGNGNESDEQVINAMEMAYKDGMDIISLSLGVDGWSENPTAIVASKLVKKGVIVVAASGNFGTNGIFTASRPAIGKGVISVASSESDVIVDHRLDFMTTSKSKWSVIPYYTNPENYIITNSSTTPTAFELATDEEGSNFGCLPYLENSDYRGKVVFAVRGNCTFTVKAKNAMEAGAIGIIFASNETSGFVPTLEESLSMPVGLLLKKDSERLLKELQSSKITVSSPDGSFATKKNDLAGKMSYFSSWGPDPELEIGITITAPGGEIFSTVPITSGSYETMSGTSMATPYMSGVFALMLEAKGKKDIEQIKSMVTQNTKLIPSDVGSRGGLSSSALSQGSGFVNVAAALDTKIVASPSALEYNYTLTSKYLTKKITITNLDRRMPLFTTLSHIPALSYSSYDSEGKYVNPPRNSTEVASVFIPRTVIVGPGRSTTISVRVAPPRKLTNNGRWFYSGFIQIKKTAYGSETINIPYTGFKGLYTDLPLLPYDDDELMPRFDYYCTASANSTEASSDPIPVDSNTTYTINPDNNQSYITLNVTTVRPSRILKLELIDIKSNKTLGYMPNGYMTYKGPLDDGSQYPLATTVNGQLFTDSDLKKQTRYSSGSYKIRLSGLKLFGNPSLPKDYETWETTTFNIKFGGGDGQCPTPSST
ncbi:hypothetical protein H4219_005495 [Mycoemilia scoparia]|uniref:Uncharacterized protein n=1 Tax=Mycoemilia scoparia TaxID=417184 RepID=A0A9W7ZMP4_9FUNG|nr:hypothetical protein H4219_005495 [Mycoemilia scoparia]